MEIATLHKVTAMPATPKANSIYFVAPPDEAADYLEVHVTGLSGEIVRSTLTRKQIQALVLTEIAAALAGIGMPTISLIEEGTVIAVNSIIQGVA